MSDFNIDKFVKTINTITISIYKTGVEVYFTICNPAQWIRLFDSIWID